MNINNKLERFIDSKYYVFGWPNKFPLKGFCQLSKFNQISIFYYLKKIIKSMIINGKPKLESLQINFFLIKKKITKWLALFEKSFISQKND